ncbi:MAG: helix-turn-helix domain-containing protein [Kiritimatiellia bacterium]|nr:helix-turn-helix domain-containing protein [Kiritimatiellia bacterium]
MNKETLPAGQAGKERPPFNEVSFLFPLLTIYTVGYLGLMIADFVLKRAFDLPDGILPVYIALLGAYAADKEIRRWIGAPEPARKGSFFVYLWLLFFLTAYIIYSFRPEYVLPNNLTAVCLQVLAIFFGSKASKYVWESRGQSMEPAVLSRRQNQVIEMIKDKGSVKNSDVAIQLGISRSTAQRLLSDMVVNGLIRQVGDRKSAFYESIS